mmetsp:Transcript_793/g.1502  ORF Transcript_793/g.1502 Transcript_793/m.1502 type:complete len:332 (-) Transcript_793:22-1017(-)
MMSSSSLKGGLAAVSAFPPQSFVAQHRKMALLVLSLLSAFMFVNKEAMYISSLYTPSQQHDNKMMGWIRPDTIYGLLHIAKTAGTEINGELASHFERVCGNKGWSYDYHQHNKRVKKFADRNPDYLNSVSTGINYGDAVSRTWTKGPNRGSVPDHFMDEVGWEDCDYVAQEMESKRWHKFSRRGKLELHVPCREPLAHLQSQCNGWRRPIKFKCDDPNDIERQIDSCAIKIDYRFRNEDLKFDPNITLKCFDPMPPSRYRDYMGNILQRKRIESTYFHRPTNQNRNKSKECIWSAGEEFQSRTRQLMIQKYEYYQFCDECMGTENELPLGY